MKKILLFVAILFVCFSAVANCHFSIRYTDGSVSRYDANYKETMFYIIPFAKTVCYYRRWQVYDNSWYDDSRKKSREDYDRVVGEINATHPGAIISYEYIWGGQEITFDENIIKKIFVNTEW